jgi:hypothetical protein
LPGSLLITIAEVNLSQTTGTDGTIQFTNVPVGSYSLQEILPNNWEFVSRSDNQNNGGNVTITTNQTVIFTNRLKPEPNNSGGSGGNSTNNNQTPSSQTGGANTNATINLGNTNSNSGNLSQSTDSSTNAEQSLETTPEETQDTDLSRSNNQPKPEVLVVAETNSQSDCQNQNFPWWLVVLLILNTLALGSYWWLQKPITNPNQNH